MILTEDQVRELIHGEEGDTLEGNDLVVLVEEGQWISGGKYDYCSCIIKDQLTQRYYRVTASRTGSYYTGRYYHYDTKAVEVVKKAVTTIKWVNKS